jgi:predicted NUDIX family NTP pyrophosphohydrolase
MKKSAGLLLYRFINDQIEFFLVHPGGPFWKNKDTGAWSIPKGEYDDSEDPLVAAKREFKEETGVEISGEFLKLLSIKQKSGKVVNAWAIEHDIDEEKIISNTFPLEWPPKSGKFIDVPEIDKAKWFRKDQALEKINPAQITLIEELCKKKATN